MEAEELFARCDPGVKNVYEYIREKVRTFGAVKIEEKKTSLHFVNHAAFLGIHPKEHFLEIEIVSARPIQDQRILKTIQVSKNRYHNLMRLEDENQLDRKLADLLREAYELLA